MTDAHTVGMLSGKVALITGASRGIGAAAAHLFAREGATVVLAARTESDLKTVTEQIVASGAEASYTVADLGDVASVDRAVATVVERYGRLDVAFNNAGIGVPPHPVADFPEADFDLVMRVNFKGVFFAVSAEVNAIRATAGRGAIVNTSSIGSLTANPALPAYGGQTRRQQPHRVRRGDLRTGQHPRQPHRPASPWRTWWPTGNAVTRGSSTASPPAPRSVERPPRRKSPRPPPGVKRTVMTLASEESGLYATCQPLPIMSTGRHTHVFTVPEPGPDEARRVLGLLPDRGLLALFWHRLDVGPDQTPVEVAQVLADPTPVDRRKWVPNPGAVPHPAGRVRLLPQRRVGASPWRRAATREPSTRDQCPTPGARGVPRHICVGHSTHGACMRSCASTS